MCSPLKKAQELLYTNKQTQIPLKDSMSFFHSTASHSDLTRAICEQARKTLASLAATFVYRSLTSLYDKAIEYFSKV